MVLTAGGRAPSAAGDKVKYKLAEAKVMATEVGAQHLQKCLIMNPLQKCKAHTSLQFGRLRSNRFGENGLTDAYRTVFPKQAAPKSHAVLFCHEQLPPDTRCGELHGGLSSRKPGVAAADCKNSVTQGMADCKPAKTEAGQQNANQLQRSAQAAKITNLAELMRQQEAELQIRLNDAACG